MNTTDGDEIDLNALLKQRVNAGQVIHVSGELDEVQARMHTATVNRLMAETGKQVVVVHTPNSTSAIQPSEQDVGRAILSDLKEIAPSIFPALDSGKLSNPIIRDEFES
jgi:hypothetical protein